MKSPLNLLTALTMGLAGFAVSAHATEQHGGTSRTLAVKPFTDGTWATLLRSGPRPAAYMFTTTYCSACPAVFQEIRDAPRKRKVHPELMVVLMDADASHAHRHASHFKGMTQLYVFEGHEPAIRSTIDPTWRNITPYVVLIDRLGHIQRVVGSPTPASLRQWLE